MNDDDDQESALSRLLSDGVLFANSRDYTDGRNAGHTVVLFVICSDIFAWAVADAEDLPYAEIMPLYRMHRADPIWGSVRWCCMRRDLQPKFTVRRSMRESGAWDDAMDALPPNPDAVTDSVAIEGVR